MKVFRTVAEARGYRASVPSLALVPTMGAFHEGHLALMRVARESSPHVAVSLFVNPLQFGPSEDFTSYPRQEERDLSLAEEAGVEAVFVPSGDEIVGEGETEVRVLSVSQGYEGDVRPIHFTGVATIVLKLFSILAPTHAVFGLKDLQQCAVVRRLVKDLFLPIELVFLETVREPSGLAMSSRNAYLSDQDRERASTLVETLRWAAAEARREGAWTSQTYKEALMKIEAAGLVPDYIDAVDPWTMRPVQRVSDSTRLVAAARLGAVRLLDNIPVRNSA